MKENLTVFCSFLYFHSVEKRLERVRLLGLSQDWDCFFWSSKFLDVSDRFDWWLSRQNARFFVWWSTIWSSSIGRIHDLIGIAVGLNMIGLMSARNWVCFVLFDQLMNLDFLGTLSALCSIICNASIVWTSYINTTVFCKPWKSSSFLGDKTTQY